MFQKILIANRGEIAVRVIRACRELGVATVAVFSEADRAALHVRHADEAYCVGPAPAMDSYLNGVTILDVARRAGAEAIHPGYGFLSESAEFVRLCQAAGLAYIGPAAEVMEQMANKTLARQLMAAQGVPVIPGGTGEVDEAEVHALCRHIGFPVMLKAVSGGGGKGMRIVRGEEELDEALRAARREAYASFADRRVFVEKYFVAARHIEVQIVADAFGKVLHLLERECSLQRRYQKVVEECPSPFVHAGLRRAMTEAAITAARAVGYVGLGTVEFLVDEEGNFYFLEMNTRIQVEHSITELVTGVDMVKTQIAVAAGRPLDFGQEEVRPRGWAMECRIYAEDPWQGHLPATGQIKKVVMPQGPGVRVDSGVYSGWTVSRHYDPMLAKLAVWGQDREEARLRMLRALGECLFHGLKTNLALHRRILTHPDFIAGRFSTAFLEQELSLVAEDDPSRHDLAIIAALCARAADDLPAAVEPPGAGLSRTDHWRMAGKYQFWASRF